MLFFVCVCEYLEYLLVVLIIKLELFSNQFQLKIFNELLQYKVQCNCIYLYPPP